VRNLRTGLQCRLGPVRMRSRNATPTAEPSAPGTLPRLRRRGSFPQRPRTLPPRHPSRASSAVGRPLNVTAAARELAITQPALSRQIHALQDALGCALFVRRHRSVDLTPAGTRLFRTADAWLDQLGEAIEALRPVDPSSVAVTSSTGFAALWLLPRLGELQATHPDVDLRVVASNRVLDRARGATELW